ncbi:SCY1-like protein 2 isoform X1 [Amblyomma americanum]
MDVFNRLRTTVSNLSTVLPGNPVTREYEIVKHVGSAGPGLLWKVFQATKRSTKEEAAVFVLEKKLLDRYSKRDREHIIELLKQGVAQLTRLRHPSILTVQHPMEESRESLAFATEPVFCSLANVLGENENMPIPPPSELKDYQLYDVEIKYGFLQVSEGLAFLHNDVKRLHRNLCPQSIVVNKKGAWKIAGFDFSVGANNPQDPQPTYRSLNLEPDLPPVAQPDLNYLAPECILADSNDSASDMFSLGVLVYAVYNKGSTLYDANSSVAALKQCINKHLKHLSAGRLGSLPEDAKEHVRMLLSVTPDIRPDAHQFSKLKFLEDVGVKTLQYLDSLYQWDNLQKSHVYKGLPQVLAQMPKRVALHRVLPCLAKEYANVDMVPFVLPSVLLIAEQATKEEFCSVILPDLIPIFRLREPVQILLIFMQKMELLLTKCPPDDIKNHVLPMIYGSLESDAQQIQELCLNIIPDFAHLIDYPSMKNALLPRIKRLCLQTSFLSVRVNCLVCLGKLLEHLDKWLVLDEILPVLPEIRSKEPAVLMGILGIYKLAMSHKKLGLTKDVMACKVIPFLMPLTIENGLTLNQFQAIMGVVKDMVAAVELEHRAKLEQLNSIKQEQSSAMEIANPNEIVPGLTLSGKANSTTSSVYDDLGISNFSAQSPNANATKSPTQKAKQQSLTIEEKQRLAREQEFQQRVQSQPSLIPAKPTPARPVHEPKDLTSTLINSNLASLNIRSPSGSSNPFGSSPGFGTSPAGDFSATVPPAASMPQWTFQTQQAMPSPMGMPSRFVTPSPQPKQQQQQVNMSAFDSLFPRTSSGPPMGAPRPTLNQMAAPASFGNFVSAPPVQNSAPVKPLSKSEMDDFLS